MAEVSVSISRQGFLILIYSLGCSITFHPNHKDHTFDALTDRLKEMGVEVSDHECLNLDVQLTNILD